MVSGAMRRRAYHAKVSLQCRAPSQIIMRPGGFAAGRRTWREPVANERIVETPCEVGGSEEPLKAVSPIAGTWRSAVHSGPVALVERFSVMSNGRSPVGHSPDYQVVLPCAGAFRFAVGRRVHFLDVNRTLFVSAGEDYWEEHPIRDLGHSSVIITPSAEVLDELCGRGGPAGHACFKDASRLTNVRARLAAHRLVGSARNGSHLQQDELAVEALRAALEPRDQPGRRAPSRAVDRARQLMHERDCQRMSLTEIARRGRRDAGLPDPGVLAHAWNAVVQVSTSPAIGRRPRGAPSLRRHYGACVRAGLLKPQPFQRRVQVGVRHNAFRGPGDGGATRTGGKGARNQKRALRIAITAGRHSSRCYVEAKNS